MNILTNQLNQIDELLAENYNSADVPPTEAVMTDAKDYLKQAFIKWGDLPPAKTITPDRDGGLRIEYIQGEKHLRLILETKQQFLYWWEGDRVNARDLGWQRDLFTKQMKWLME